MSDKASTSARFKRNGGLTVEDRLSSLENSDKEQWKEISEMKLENVSRHNELKNLLTGLITAQKIYAKIFGWGFGILGVIISGYILFQITQGGAA